MTSINLTQTEAEARSELIDAVHYNVTLDVTGEERFSTTTVVSFTTRGAGSTFIDLRTDRDGVQSALLDGAPLDVSGYEAEHGIPLNDLEPGEHILQVVATVPYSRTGEGLHRAVDPSDGQVYLYTQFETADAKRVFACFDQPDIKATYDFKVTTRTGDVLITNEPVNYFAAEDDTVEHHSSIDYPLSTYLIAFCVGPYTQVTDTWRGRLTLHPETPADFSQIEGKEIEIPLSIYTRASVADSLDAARLFTETKQGFDFFHRNFGVPYPFTKYDQVFVPEFNAGAMENAGCVTIRDEYVFTSEATHYQYERRAETILHEMAHMWFGDLVTMEWWGDLWLNESFATWSAAISQAEQTQYDTAWVTFANVEKAWAYAQDQLPTTHPISTDASDIETVEQNFDGITYAKGASVLKQLQAYVGRENFFAGVRRHFATHAWSNATFEDLLASLEKASGRDLSFWADQWLKTTGVNVLSPAFEITDGVYSEFAVRQSGETLRTHRIAVGVYKLVDDVVRRTHQVEIDIEGDTTAVPSLVGVEAGDFVLVNDDDLTYALLDLDDASLDFIVANIDKIADPMARTLCWSAAWEMTRDSFLPAREFIALVIRGARAETEMAVLERILSQAVQALDSFADPAWAKADTRLATMLLDGAENAAPERALVYQKALAQIRLTEEAAEYFSSLLESSEDADTRWRALTALVARGDMDAAAVDKQLELDPSSSGALAAKKALAARPSPGVKAELVNALVAGDMSNVEARHQLAGLTFGDAAELLRPFNSTYFEVAVDVWARLSTEMSSSILTGIYPSWDITDEGVARADEFLAREDLTPGLRRQTLELRDRQARALRNRRADAA